MGPAGELGPVHTGTFRNVVCLEEKSEMVHAQRREPAEGPVGRKGREKEGGFGKSMHLKERFEEDVRVLAEVLAEVPAVEQAGEPDDHGGGCQLFKDDTRPL